MVEKGTKMIPLSKLYNIFVPEVKVFPERKTVEGTQWRLNKKEKWITYLWDFYKKNGDFNNLSFTSDNDSARKEKNDKLRKKLNYAIQEIISATIEQILKPTTFTFWRKGNVLSVLEPVGGKDPGNIIVKFVNPGVDFEKDVEPGYKLAKLALGPVEVDIKQKIQISVKMVIASNICINVRDAENLPRIIQLDKVLIQERVIVLGDLIDSLKEKEIVGGEKEIKKLGKMFESLFKMFKEIGVDDDDKIFSKNRLGEKDSIDLKSGCERNYGLVVPPDAKGIVFFDGKGSKRVAESYLLNKRFGKNFPIAAFDFDKFVKINEESEIIGNRVPDLFVNDIEREFKKFLKRMITEA